MKFWKWFSFISEGSSEERLRSDYQQLSDRQLSQLDTSVLTTLALKVYREEVARRKAGGSAQTLSPDTKTE